MTVNFYEGCSSMEFVDYLILFMYTFSYITGWPATVFVLMGNLFSCNELPVTERLLREASDSWNEFVDIFPRPLCISFSVYSPVDNPAYWKVIHREFWCPFRLNTNRKRDLLSLRTANSVGTDPFLAVTVMQKRGQFVFIMLVFGHVRYRNNFSKWNSCFGTV
jgi:hypothetical protein